MDDFQIKTLYKNGKQRRYNLLFAVNGGAFAIIKFVEEHRECVSPHFLIVAVGMIVFTLVMTYDIWYNNGGSKVRRGAVEDYSAGSKRVSEYRECGSRKQAVSDRVVADAPPVGDSFRHSFLKYGSDA